jgi:hypothetical protein
MSQELAPGREVPDRCLQDLRQLAEAVNGFVYHGDALEAVCRTVRILRANPSFAKRLLDLK